MKNVFKIISLILLITSFGLLIFSLQLRQEVLVKEKSVTVVLESWSNYIDSMKIESKAYQDTIKNLRLELDK